MNVFYSVTSPCANLWSLFVPFKWGKNSFFMCRPQVMRKLILSFSFHFFVCRRPVQRAHLHHPLSVQMSLAHPSFLLTVQVGAIPLFYGLSSLCLSDWNVLLLPRNPLRLDLVFSLFLVQRGAWFWWKNKNQNKTRNEHAALRIEATYVHSVTQLLSRSFLCAWKSHNEVAWVQWTACRCVRACMCKWTQQERQQDGTSTQVQQCRIDGTVRNNRLCLHKEPPTGAWSRLHLLTWSQLSVCSHNKLPPDGRNKGWTFLFFK